MRTAMVRQHGVPAGYLEEDSSGSWTFRYVSDYAGPAVSLTMPVVDQAYRFDRFPAVFEGLLPEGPSLEAVLRRHKIDRHDLFRLLVTLGGDLVGSLTVEECEPAVTKD